MAGLGRGGERDGAGRRGCVQDCSDGAGEEIARGRGEGCVIDVATGVRSDEFGGAGEGEGNGVELSGMGFATLSVSVAVT